MSMSREPCKGGWLQQKIQRKTSKKKEPGYKEWVVFCVHDDKIPLLEVFAGEGVANKHSPIKVTDLLDCAHVSSQIGDDRSFIIGFMDPSRPNLEYTAPNPVEKEEWIQMLTFKLTHIGCLDDGENLYSPLPKFKPAANQYEILTEASSDVAADPTLSQPEPIEEMGAQNSTLNAGPVLDGPPISDRRDQNGNEQPEDLYERISEGPRSNTTLPNGSPRLGSRKDLPTPISPTFSPTRNTTTPSYTEIVPKAQRAQLAAEVLNEEPPPATPPPIPPRTNNVVKKPITLDSKVPVSSFVGKADPDARYKQPPLRNNSSGEDTSYSTLSQPTFPVGPASSGYDTLSSIQASNNNHGRASSKSPEFSGGSDGHNNLSVSPRNMDLSNEYSQLPARSPPRSFQYPSQNSYQTLSFPIPTTSQPESGAIYQHYEQLPTQARPVPAEELLRMTINAGSEDTVEPSEAVSPNAESEKPTYSTLPSPGRVPISHHISVDSPHRGSKKTPNTHPASDDNSTASSKSPSNPRQVSVEHSHGSSKPTTSVRRGPCVPSPPPLPPRNQDIVTPPVSPAPAVPTATKKLSLYEVEVHKLQKEIEFQKSINIKLDLGDATEGLAVVAMDGKLWIAGWPPQYHKRLSRGFHIGDMIARINGAETKSFRDYNLALKTSSTTINFTIKRMPYGQIKLLKRETQGEPLGINLAQKKNKIESITPGSIADRAGLTAKGKGFRGEEVPHVITEVNGRPLNLFAHNGEARNRLDAVGSEISVLLQPKDFIRALKDNLKSRKNWKDYQLG